MASRKRKRRAILSGTGVHEREALGLALFGTSLKSRVCYRRRGLAFMQNAGVASSTSLLPPCQRGPLSHNTLKKNTNVLTRRKRWRFRLIDISPRQQRLHFSGASAPPSFHCRVLWLLEYQSNAQYNVFLCQGAPLRVGHLQRGQDSHPLCSWS